MANIFQQLAAYMVPGTPAVKADKPPRNPYLGYSTGMGGYAYELYPNSPAGWMAAAQYNVWAKNCINARMSFVSKANLKLWQCGEDGKPEEVTDHPVLPLLREVNPLNANRKSFKRGIEQQLCVFGRCVILKVTGYRDMPAELYILPRQMVEVIPDPVQWIAGYRWLPTGQVYQPSEIIDLFYPSNDGTPAEASPTASAVGAITRYSLSDVAQAAIDRRGGQGGGIVFYPDNLDPKEFEAMRQSWENIRSNPNNAGRDIHVSSALKYESGALTARDMQREERASRLMKEIMAAYQVPPAIAGDYSDASILANADAQQSAFAEQWGIEELEFIEEGLNNQLLWQHWPETRDAGMYLAHDLAEIPALREDEQAKEAILQTKIQSATIAMAGTLISLNEARQMIGQPEVNDPRADAVPIVEPAAGSVPVQDMASSDMPAQDAQDMEDSGNMPSDMASGDMADSGNGAQPANTPPADAAAQPVAQPAQAALNGAQIASLVSVIQSVSSGQLAVNSAKEVIRVSFPTIDQATIESMVNAAKTVDITQPVKARRIIADYVGVQVRTPAGDGVIEKVLRFGEHDGKTATKAAPLFLVNGMAYTADELEVIE